MFLIGNQLRSYFVLNFWIQILNIGKFPIDFLLQRCAVSKPLFFTSIGISPGMVFLVTAAGQKDRPFLKKEKGEGLCWIGLSPIWKGWRPTEEVNGYARGYVSGWGKNLAWFNSSGFWKLKRTLESGFLTDIPKIVHTNHTLFQNRTEWNSNIGFFSRSLSNHFYG